MNYPLWNPFIKFIKESKKDGKPLSQDPVIRSKVAQIEVEREIGRLFNYSIAVTEDTDGDHKGKGDHTIIYMYGGEFQQREIETITEIMGLHGMWLRTDQLGSLLGQVGRYYHYCKTATLRSTPTEALLDKIATTVLGFPSHLDPPKK